MKVFLLGTLLLCLSGYIELIESIPAAAWWPIPNPRGFEPKPTGRSWNYTDELARTQPDCWINVWTEPKRPFAPILTRMQVWQDPITHKPLSEPEGRPKYQPNQRCNRLAYGGVLNRFKQVFPKQDSLASQTSASSKRKTKPTGKDHNEEEQNSLIPSLAKFLCQGSQLIPELFPKAIEKKHLNTSICTSALTPIRIVQLDLQLSKDTGQTYLLQEMLYRSTANRKHGSGYFAWETTIGINYYVEMKAEIPIAAIEGAGYRSGLQDKTIPYRITAIINYNLERDYTLFAYSHTKYNPTSEETSIETLEETGTVVQANGEVKETVTNGVSSIEANTERSEASDKTPMAKNKSSVRIVCYNVWNTNPAHWVFKFPSQLKNQRARTKRYHRRMKLLSEYIRSENPDIVAFQELRYDDSLLDLQAIKRKNKGKRSSSSGKDVDNTMSSSPKMSPYFQLDHILHYLRKEKHSKLGTDENKGGIDEKNCHNPTKEEEEDHHQDQREGGDYSSSREQQQQQCGTQYGQKNIKGNRYPFFSFTPAMTYYDVRTMNRVEEGTGIVSKYPILNVPNDYLLLSRNVNDKSDADDHQRVCAHSIVDVPGWGKIDIYNVHLSLSKKARDKAVVALYDFIETNSTGVTQILLGDMNAEPHEFSMRFLSGKEEVSVEDTDTPLPEIRKVLRSNFQDLWLKGPDGFEPIKGEGGVRGEFAKEFVYTFPSDDPKKRIDFAFIRGKGAPKNGDEGKRQSRLRLFGQDPIPRKNPDENYDGMLHPNSPLWASDHRGLVIELEN
eukprot:g440.t1